jgi:hypothetical protein
MLLVLLLQQTPPPRTALVLVTRQIGVNKDISAQVTRDLRKALAFEGIDAPFGPDALPAKLLAAGLKDPKDCAGKKECIVGAGTKLGVTHLVSLGLQQVGIEVTITVEALRLIDGERFAADVFTVPANQLGGVFTAFAPFAGRVHDALSPRKLPGATVAVAPGPAVVATPAPADAPKKEAPPPKLVPAPVVTGAPPQVVATKSGLTAPRVGAIVVAGAGVAALVVSAILIGTGTSTKARLDQRVVTGSDQQGLPLTHAQAQAVAGSANAQLSGALACGVAAIALGTGAGLLWVRSGEP